ncbi:hypothetical protein C0J52_26790 [Blattella germanica]|nr:hypothetical protein C0J52_26790 [Blattella germanica]
MLQLLLHSGSKSLLMTYWRKLTFVFSFSGKKKMVPSRKSWLMKRRHLWLCGV